MRHNVMLRFVLPPVLRFLNPTYSYCEKCGLPWNWCESKSVNINTYSSTFATCQYCWDNSSIEEVKQCYTKTYQKQQKSLMGTPFKMGHSLNHLLKCVEVEYERTHVVN